MSIVLRGDLPTDRVVGVAFMGENTWFTSGSGVTADPDVADAGFDRNVLRFRRTGFQLVRAYDRTFKIAVFPLSALENRALRRLHADPDHIVGPERPRHERESILLALARDPETKLDGLTPARPIPGVSLQPFGGSYGQ